MANEAVPEDVRKLVADAFRGVTNISAVAEFIAVKCIMADRATRPSVSASPVAPETVKEAGDDPAYLDGPFYYMPMPINAEGNGPEMDHAKVQWTQHEVWNVHYLSVATARTAAVAKAIAAALNAASPASPSRPVEAVPDVWIVMDRDGGVLVPDEFADAVLAMFDGEPLTVDGRQLNKVVKFYARPEAPPPREPEGTS